VWCVCWKPTTRRIFVAMSGTSHQIWETGLSSKTITNSNKNLTVIKLVHLCTFVVVSKHYESPTKLIGLVQSVRNVCIYIYIYVYIQVLGCLRYIPPHFKIFLRLGKTDACQSHINILTMKDNKWTRHDITEILLKVT
jgi:hypothetical protein